MRLRCHGDAGSIHRVKKSTAEGGFVFQPLSFPAQGPTASADRATHPGQSGRATRVHRVVTLTDPRGTAFGLQSDPSSHRGGWIWEGPHSRQSLVEVGEVGGNSPTLTQN